MKPGLNSKSWVQKSGKDMAKQVELVRSQDTGFGYVKHCEQFFYYKLICKNKPGKL